MKDGANTNLKNLSSAAIRIAREYPGVGKEVLEELLEDGVFCSTLLLSPPGGGKTTLLRDLVCLLSRQGFRMALIDERGEVAVMHRGEPQMDVGPCTDVLDGCPKALGIPIVLRAMNPQIIAVDEITAQEDLQAVSLAAGCGVELLATIHAGDAAQLREKPLYRQLLEQKIFTRAVCICPGAQGRRYRVEHLI